MFYEEFISKLSVIFSSRMMKAVLVLMLVVVELIIDPQNVYAQEKVRASGQTPSAINQPIPIVDAHVHLNNVAMQLELMKKYGVERSVVFWGRDSDNESLLKAAHDYPDKFIPFVSVSPERSIYRQLWERDDPKLLTMLEDYLKSGAFKGIGEISVTLFPNAAFTKPISVRHPPR